MKSRGGQFAIGILVILVVVAGIVAYYYYNQSSLYVTTDNAQIAGQAMTIAAPATGKLVNWKIQDGISVPAGDTVGKIQALGPQATPPINITMPRQGTIVANNGINNEIVAAGTPLATAYNLNNLWVMANINETSISQVKAGETVDIHVDAFPGMVLQGTVQKIIRATAATFSLLPSTGTNANYTKVTQVIPVKITLPKYGAALSPGMSVTVRIHKVV